MQTISRLLDKAKLGPEQRLMVENLALLRSTIEDTGEIQLQEWEQKKKKKIAEEVPYAVSRYVPVVKRLVEVHSFLSPLCQQQKILTIVCTCFRA